MTHQTSGNQDKTERQPVYMGKTLAVMNYTVAAIALVVSLGIGWVVSHLHANGFAQAGIPRGWSSEVIILSITSLLAFILSLLTFIMPTLRAEHSRFRPDQVDCDKLNRSWRRQFDRSWRRKAIEYAPKPLCRWIRICHWCGVLMLLGWFGFAVLDAIIQTIFSTQSLLKAVVGPLGRYDLFFFIVTIAPFWIAKDIIIHRAVKLYERDLARTETNTAHCPDCDYPIDREHGMRVCPECGFALSPET